MFPSQFGFITYEVGESKRLFFHVKEVQDGLELQTGDEVEFAVVLNQRTGKCSACNVRRVRYGGPKVHKMLTSAGSGPTLNSCALFFLSSVLQRGAQTRGHAPPRSPGEPPEEHHPG